MIAWKYLKTRQKPICEASIFLISVVNVSCLMRVNHVTKAFTWFSADLADGFVYI